MTEQLRQSLSAVIDGEADAFEMRRVLDEIDRDPALRDTWDRYHLIGSVIRGERTSQSRSAARVLERRVPLALRESGAAPTAPRDDLPPLEPATGARRRWRPAAFGLAIAASVVLAAAVILQSPGPETVSGAASTAAAEEIQQERGLATVAAGAPADVSSVAQAASATVPQADLRRTQAYMLQHAQQHGVEQRGVISLVKMAAYEAP